MRTVRFRVRYWAHSCRACERPLGQLLTNRVVLQQDFGAAQHMLLSRDRTLVIPITRALPAFGTPVVPVGVRMSRLSSNEAGKAPIFTPVRKSSGEYRCKYKHSLAISS